MSTETFFKNKIKKIDWLFVSLMAAAIFFHLFMLGVRPPHHDEGINGWFADQMTFHGCYKYDPSNYHGPLHFYTVFLFQTLIGRSSFILRLPTALISILTVFLITKYSRFFGRTAAYIAAFAFVLSPGMEFYGRYAIHESDFVFFFILIFWGILGLYKEGHKKYLWSVVLGITGLIVTKETYIIHLVCFVAAWYLLLYLDKYFKNDDSFIPAKQSWNKNDLRNSILVGIAIILLLYTGFFVNYDGFFGIFETMAAWTNTGVHKGGHSKPFSYWMTLSLRYEHIFLIAAFLSIQFFSKLSRWSRLLTLYGFLTLGIYSVISYKTPWCIISIIWPFYFVFGELAADFIKTKWKTEVTFALAALFLLSAFLTCRLNFFHYDDNKEPYVYVHTFRNIDKFVQPLLKIVKVDNANYNLTGHVIRDGEWPLPWILGDFTMIGYYTNNTKPLSYDGDFLLVESKKIMEVESGFKNKYFVENLTMRDSQDPSKAYFSYEKFKHIFPNRTPEFIPTPLLPGQGLLAEYFINKNWSGEPVSLKQADKIDFYWEGENKILPAPFSATYSGDIYFPKTPREIIFASDDGGFVEINGQRIIDDPGPHGITETKYIVQGEKGWKKIKVGFYDEGGGAVVKLFWIDDLGNKTIVTKEFLRFNESQLENKGMVK
jgi:uncharacterized protein (TIGR03663 family)